MSMVRRADDQPAEVDRRSPGRWYRRPFFQIVMVLAILAAGCGLGWVLAVTFESPEQRAANASPPPPSVITAVVKTGTLASTINVRTTLVLANESTTSISKVVTRAPVSAGQEVTQGQVLLELEGQPLFVLKGAFPFYRDLATNSTGPDVSQLQAALRGVGFDVPDTGRYDWATIVAVSNLYDRAGYQGYDGRSFGPGQAIAVGGFPATLNAVPPVGRPTTGSDQVSIGFGAPVARGALPSEMQPFISVGQEAQLSLDTGELLSAIVKSIEPPQAEGENATIVFEAKLEDGSDLDLALIGSGGIAVVTITSVAEEALLVPTSAVAHGQDGSAFVLVETEDGSFAQTPVTELGELDGVTAVAPGESLRVDDVVRTE